MQCAMRNTTITFVIIALFSNTYNAIPQHISIGYTSHFYFNTYINQAEPLMCNSELFNFDTQINQGSPIICDIGLFNFNTMKGPTYTGYAGLFSFNTMVLPPPLLVAPYSNGTLPGPPFSFIWNMVNGAGAYHLKISDNSSFIDPIVNDLNIPGDQTSYLLTTALEYGQAYYWQMRTLNESGTEWGGWCQYQLFIPTITSELELIFPGPSQMVEEAEITFTWSPIENATYELYVDNNSGLGSPEISPQHIPELQNLTTNHYTISANWLRPDQTYYWKAIAITATGTVESGLGTFVYAPPKLEQPAWVPFYRAFNSNVVDHFYCSSESHLLQAMDGNYSFEGVEGYVSLHPFMLTSPDTLKPIYRFYIPNEEVPKRSCHYYTTSDSDRDNRIIQGWIYEGITGYGFNQPKEGLTKLYHTWLNVPGNRMDNFYTISEIEKNNSISLFGYTDQGFITYVSATGDNATMPWLPNSMAVGRGINPQNGNLAHYNSNIFTISEGQTTLNYGHFYNSSAVRLFSNHNPLGNGWNHSYNSTLITTDNNVIIVWADEVHLYNKQSLNAITPGVYDNLLYINQNKYQIKKKDQTIYTFEKLPVSNTENTFWLTSISDRYNNTIVLNYNNRGWLKTVKSPANRYISFTYYPNDDKARAGLVRYAKDSLVLNRTVEYIYDTMRNLTGFIDAEGQLTQFTYNNDHPYDHFLKTIIFADGSKIENTFDPGSRRLIEQDFVSDSRNSYKTTISLPAANHVTVSDALGNQTGIKFNDLGNITELINASGTAVFEFSDTANPTKPTKITDGMGFITTVSYDNSGNPLHVTKPLGILHQYQWNSFNDLTLYTDPRNKQTSYTYQNGALTAIQTPRGIFNLTYFANGNIHTFTDPLIRTTSFGYNSNNNLTNITDNIGNVTNFTYDQAGRVIQSINANNQLTVYNYDNNDQLISTIDALGNNTTYEYDQKSRLISVTDARSNSTSMIYDNITGWIERTTDQLGSQTLFTYYDNGLLQSIVTRNNQIIFYAYDNSNRLTGVAAPSISRNFSYNANNRMISVTDNNGVMSYNYDELNRLTGYSDFYGNQVQYQYDLASNITKIIYPGNKTVNYTFYDDNLLHTVTDWLGNTSTYTYRNDGSLQRLDYPNGTYFEYSYDGAGRITGMHTKKSNGDIIASYNYTLDAVGNHLSAETNEPLSMPSFLAEDVSYAYDNANRIISAGDVSFTHDLNGNITSKSGGGADKTFWYDAEDMLTGVSGSFNANYVYDAMGMRRQAMRNGVTTRYVLDINSSMEHVLMEINATNAPQYYYIHGNGMIYRISAAENAAQYYHYDYRGSTVAITDHVQNITHKYAYDEFGKVLDAEETDFNPFRFVGRHGVIFEIDDLYFMRARFYNPDIGRFVSEDPVWFPNLYSYANENPVLYIDPLGNVSSEIENSHPYAVAAYETAKGTLGTTQAGAWFALFISLIEVYGEISRTQQRIYLNRIEQIDNLAGMVVDGSFGFNDAISYLTENTQMRLTRTQKDHLRFLLSSRIIQMLQERRSHRRK